MENPANTIENVFNKIEAYIKTTYQLNKLKAIQVSTVVITSVISKICVILVLFLSLITLSLGAAFYLGTILGNDYYGFFIIAAFYFLVAIILFFYLHKWIRKYISSFIIKLTLK